MHAYKNDTQVYYYVSDSTHVVPMIAKEPVEKNCKNHCRDCLFPSQFSRPHFHGVKIQRSPRRIKAIVSSIPQEKTGYTLHFL